MGNNNEYMSEYISKRQTKLKHDAVSYKGGKCIKCGYNKCVAALDFHHRDPTKKEVTWRYLRRRSWDRITKELDKCDLLCSNCHAELHYDPQILQNAIKYLEQKRNHRESRITKGTTGNCIVCGKEFIRNRGDRNKKHCSYRCVGKSQERIEWPSHADLLDMVNKNGKVKTGAALGISPNAIKKRLDRSNPPAPTIENA